MEESKGHILVLAKNKHKINLQYLTNSILITTLLSFPPKNEDIVDSKNKPGKYTDKKLHEFSKGSQAVKLSAGGSLSGIRILSKSLSYASQVPLFKMNYDKILPPFPILTVHGVAEILTFLSSMRTVSLKTYLFTANQESDIALNISSSLYHSLLMSV